MKRCCAAVLLLLTFVLVTAPCGAQPDINNEPKTQNPVILWDREKIGEVFTQNLRDYLNAAGVKEPTTQTAIQDYFQQAQYQDKAVMAPPGAQLRDAALKLSEKLRQESTAQAIAMALVEYDAALVKFKEHRHQAALELDATIGYSKNPRLYGALLLLGAATDAPSFFPSEALYALESGNLPTTAPLPAGKVSVHLWSVAIDPAMHDAMQRYLNEMQIKYFIEREKADATLPAALVAYNAEMQSARRQLEDRAIPLYLALISPELFPDQVVPEKAVLAYAEDYKTATDEYQERTRQALLAFEQQTNLKEKPRLKAELILNGVVTNGPTVVPDRQAVRWSSANWRYLYGKNARQN